MMRLVVLSLLLTTSALAGPIIMISGGRGVPSSGGGGGTPTDVAMFGGFETGSNGDTITTTLLDSAFEGVQATNWCTAGGGGDYSCGASNSELTISTSCAHAIDQDLTANGNALGTTSSTRGMRVAYGNNATIILLYQPSQAPSVGFHLQFWGAQQNFSPRDVGGWHNSASNFSFLQLYDTDGVGPYAHYHWQPGGSGQGPKVYIQRNHWYWISWAWIAGTSTHTLYVYDAEDGYSLVGTSTGSFTGNTTMPFVMELGGAEYSWSADATQGICIDNVIMNFNNTEVPTPTG